MMLMGLSMTGPMVLWMSYRGHSAWRNIEMAASMLMSCASFPPRKSGIDASTPPSAKATARPGPERNLTLRGRLILVGLVRRVRRNQSK